MIPTQGCLYTLKFRIKDSKYHHWRHWINKQEQKKWKSLAPLFQESPVIHDLWRGLCSDLRILQHPLHPLAKTHWPDIEAKPVCEVHSSLYCYISEREQMEVFKLKHRLTSSWNVVFSRLTHKKNTIYIFVYVSVLFIVYSILYFSFLISLLSHLVKLKDFK